MTSQDFLHSAREALQRFGLQEARIKTLNRERNAVFRVDVRDGRRFVLRLRSAERFDDAAAAVQMRWLERLGRRTTLGAPIPLRTKANRLFAHVNVGDETWRATCLSWVDGQSPRGRSFLRPPLLRAVGRSVAGLHANAAKFHPSTIDACPRLDANYFFGPRTCVGSGGREFLSAKEHDTVRRAATRIRRAMRRVEHSEQHVGLIHGDLEPPNWVIRAGVPRPIDFDEFGIGFFAFDLMQVLWTHALWREYPQFRADLLTGYESVRPIADEDRQALDLFQAIPFLVWLNRGSREAAQAEFRQWVGPTVRRIGELCGVG